MSSTGSDRMPARGRWTTRQWIITLFMLGVLALGSLVGHLTAVSVRAAPCSINWTGAVGTSWDVGGNWDTNAVPGPTDDVCIEPASSITVVRGASSTSVNGITLNADASLEITSGNLTVTGTANMSTIGGDLTLSGSGDVTFAAGVAVAGAIEVTGSGAVLFLDGPSATGSLNLDGASSTILRKTNSGSAGSLDVSGAFTWGTSQILFIPVTIEGESTWAGATKTIGSGAGLTLNGDTAWTAGSVQLGTGGGGQLQVGPGVNLQVDFDATMAGASGTVTNNGTITFNGTGVTTIAARFDNNGSIVWGSAGQTVALTGGGTNVTSVDIPNGRTLQLAGSTSSPHVWTPESNLTGTGTLHRAGSGPTNFQGGFDFTGDIVTTGGSGTITARATVASVTMSQAGSTTSPLLFADGVDVAGNVSVSGAAALYLHGPSTAGSLTLTGTGLQPNITMLNALSGGSLVVSGPFEWTSGTFGYIPVSIEGESTWPTSAQLKRIQNGSIVTLEADGVWSGGVLDLEGTTSALTSGHLVIDAGANLQVQQSGTVVTNGGTGTRQSSITNGGTVTVNGSGTTTISAIFNNDGSIVWGSIGQTLELRGGGGTAVSTVTSTLDVPAGNALQLTGTSTWTGASNLTGPGSLLAAANTDFSGDFDFSGDIISSGTVSVSSLANVASVDVTGGHLTFLQGAHVIGGIAITNLGILSLNGPSTAASLTLTGTGGQAAVDGSGGSLGVTGPFTWGMGFINSIPVTIQGDSTWLSNGNRGINGAVLTLNGDTAWDGGSSSMLNAARIINNATLDVIASASLGQVAGTGQRIDNNGTLKVGGSAVLTLIGSDPLFQGPGATLRFEVLGPGGPGVGHGQIIGYTSLPTGSSGDLEIDVPEGFVPQSGVDYTLITQGSVGSSIGFDAFTRISDLISGNTVVPPPNLVDSLTHTWEVLYAPTTQVILHTYNIFPFAADDEAETLEDDAVVIDVAANDSDDEGIDLGSLLIVGSPDNGTAVMGDAGVITYTPDPDWNGVDTFAYLICDTMAKCDTATVTITVSPVNDAPSFTKGANQTVPEDSGPHTVPGWATNIAAGPNEAAQAVSFAIDANTNPDLFAFGPVVDDNGGLSFTLAADANGAATIGVVATDDGGTANGGIDTSAVQLFTITVTEVNDPPSAADDVASLAEDGSATIDVLANDSPGPGNESAQTLAVTDVTQGGHGSVTNNGTDLSYSPDPDYNGSDSFTYTACDDGTTAGVLDSLCDTATVTVTVTEVNDPPSAADDVASLAEDGSATIDVLANDSPGPGNESAQTLAVTDVTQGGHGSVTNNGTDLSYSPDPDYNGSDSFTYTACDDGTTAGVLDSLCDTATVTVTVTEVNDPPSAADDVASLAEDGSATIDVLANDSPGPGNESAQTLAVTDVTQGGHGSVTNNGTDLSYSPDPDYNGSDSFTYTACDDGTTAGVLDSLCDTATVTVTVTEVNDPPSAADDVASLAEDGSATIDVLANDSPGPGNESAQTLAVTDVTQGGHGSVTNNGTDLSYSPDPDYNGSDSFTYTACDDGTTAGVLDSLCDTATVTVTVTEVNDPPSAADDVASLAEDGSATIDVLANDSPGPGNESAQTLAVTDVTQGGHGSVTNNGTDLSYSPDPDYNGSDSFTYTACDDGTTAGVLDSLCDTATVTVTVTEVNDPPSAADDVASLAEDGSATIDVLANDSPGPGNESAQTLAVTDVTQGGHGSVTNNGTDLSYSPDPDYNGSDSFTYTACDDGTTAGVLDSLCDTATVTVTVTEVNDAPVGTDMTITIAEDGALVFDVADFGFSDTADSPPDVLAAVTITTGPAVGSLTLGGDPVTDGDTVAAADISAGNLVYSPEPGASGVGYASLTFQVKDDGGTANGGVDLDPTPNTITIDVSSVNDPPTITSSATAAVDENQTAAIDVDAVDDTDTEGAGLSYAITGGADAGLFAIDPATGVVTFLAAPDYEAPADADANNAYELQVTVTDSGALTDVQAITISVLDVAENSAPTITSSATAAVDENQTAAIDVDAVDDTDTEGAGLSYAITGGADAGLFAIDPATGVVTFLAAPDYEAPADADANNAYELQVTVTDSGALTDVQAITISVLDVAENSAPTITSSATAAVDENQTAAIDVDAVDDTDTEGAGLSYAITGGADAGLFAIDPATGVVTFLAAPDYEAPADADANNAYELQVTVTDSGALTDVQAITISVLDVAENSAPTITSSATAAVDENQTAAIDVDAVDDTDTEGAGLSYAITGGADAGLFAIDPATGVVTFLAAPDYEAPADADANNAYELQVTVTDSGALTDVQAITISVLDVAENSAPTITSSATAAVDENQTAAIDVDAVDDTDTEGAGLSYAITGGADAGLFAIDPATGVVTFLAAPDYEAPADADANNAYELQVTVTDSGALTDVQAITISVLDVAENSAPTITSSATAAVDENQTAAIDVDAVDDTDTEGAGLSYAITGGADAGLFAIDPATGVVTFLAAPDYEAPADADANNAYELQVTVTDSGALTDVQAITISVLDVAENSAPTITSSATAAVDENQTAAIDVDAVDDTDTEGAGLSYAITGGADAGLFAIDPATGVVTFLAAPDYEAPADADANNAYELQVTVTDSGALTDVQAITISVLDVAENSTGTVTVEFSGVAGVRVELREDDGTPGTATGPLVDLVQGQDDEATFADVPFGSYDLKLLRGAATLVVDAVVVAGDVTAGDLVETLTVDLEGLTGIRLEVRTSDGSTATTGSLVEARNGQSGVVGIEVLRGVYELVAKQGAGKIVVDPIDCTSACTAGDLVETLTVDLEGLTGIRLEVRTSDGSTATTGSLVEARNGQSGVVGIEVLRGVYELVAKQGAGKIVVDPIDCTSACTAGDLVETLTVDLEGLTGIRLEVRTSDGSTATTGSLVEARNGQSGVVGIEVLRGVYELVAKQGAGKLVVDPIDCTSACTAGDLVETLTVDLEGLTGIRLEVRTSDGSTATTGSLVEARNGQSGVVGIEVLRGVYELVAKQGAGKLVVDPIDCTSACTAGDLVETLTVDLEGLTGIRLEVRTSDGSTATTGSLVEARNGQSGVVGIEVLRGVYELVAKQGAGKLVVDPIDCTSACTAGDLVETLTVDLEGLTGIRLEVRTSDGSTATTGSLVEARNGQSGVVGIEVLRGVYELVAKQGAGKLVVDPIDCTSGAS